MQVLFPETRFRLLHAQVHETCVWRRRTQPLGQAPDYSALSTDLFGLFGATSSDTRGLLLCCTQEITPGSALRTISGH